MGKKRAVRVPVKIPVVPAEVIAAGGPELQAWELWRKMRAWGLGYATLGYCRQIVGVDPGPGDQVRAAGSAGWGLAGDD